MDSTQHPPHSGDHTKLFLYGVRSGLELKINKNSYIRIEILYGTRLKEIYNNDSATK